MLKIPAKLFSDLYLVKFLNSSAKLLFQYKIFKLITTSKFFTLLIILVLPI